MFTLKKALTAFVSDEPFVVSTTAEESRYFNAQKLRQSFIGGKSKQAISGRTIKALGVDS